MELCHQSQILFSIFVQRANAAYHQITVQSIKLVRQNSFLALCTDSPLLLKLALIRLVLGKVHLSLFIADYSFCCFVSPAQ